jgi:hypothetical protein
MTWKENSMSGCTALSGHGCPGGVVERFGSDQSYLDRVAGAIKSAGDAGILVVFVRVAFRPGLPEVSSKNKSFPRSPALPGQSSVKTMPQPSFTALSRPFDGEVVVTKRRVWPGWSVTVRIQSRAPEARSAPTIAAGRVINFREELKDDYGNLTRSSTHGGGDRRGLRHQSVGHLAALPGSRHPGPNRPRLCPYFHGSC